MVPGDETVERRSGVETTLTESLLSDKTSGIKADATGRRYFRQRRVSFETITIDETELHAEGWLGFKALPFLSWETIPEPSVLREFAKQSSERYIAFWYRVFDVAVARALAGHDREIFRKPFFSPSVLFDIGISARHGFGSIPPALHKKIMEEYTASLRYRPRHRVFYISEYLNGLTDDVIDRLKPFDRLWQLRKEGGELSESLGELHLKLRQELQIQIDGIPVEQILLSALNGASLRSIDRIIEKKLEKTVASDEVRKLIFKRKQHDLDKLTDVQLSLLLDAFGEIALPGPFRDLYEAIHSPSERYRIARSACARYSAALRLSLRKSKIRYFQRAAARTEQLNHAIRRHIEGGDDRLQQLETEKERRAIRILSLIGRTARRFAQIHTGEGHAAQEFVRQLLISLDPLPESEAGIAQAFESYRSETLRFRENGEAIVAIYETFLERGAAPLEERDESASSEDRATSRYAGCEMLRFPNGVDPSNPFQEQECLEAARRLIADRLRPLRMTATDYSTIAGERHGAITLNPVMRLWKERPFPSRKEEPAILSREINTKESVDCLLSLAGLVDPDLARRTVQRGAIRAAKRGVEDLSTLTLFLLPGSCVPLRELDRRNFPEFYGKVIGESRNPVELGVDPHQNTILTGGWYQNRNHTLYYPVGGDNGMLIRHIYNASRLPVLPAFFFALGQFVHDTLPDSLVYYASGETTFRHCIEDYYLLEDRFRKNRGEKTGRKKADNSRPAIRFMFALHYARLLMEALSGSSQSQFRHPETDRWIEKHVGLPLLHSKEREFFREIRKKTREVIAGFS